MGIVPESAERKASDVDDSKGPSVTERAMTEESEGTERPSLGAPALILLATVAVVGPVFATGFSQFEVVKEYVLVTGVGLATLVWGIKVALEGRVALVAGRVVAMLLAFAGYAVLSVTWAEGVMYALPSAIQVAMLAAAVAVVSAPVGREIAFDDLAVAVAAGVVGAGLFGVADFAGLKLFTPVWNPPGPAGAFDAMEFAATYYAVALPILVGAAVWFDGAARWLFAVGALIGTAHFALVAQWFVVWLVLGAGAVVSALLVLLEGTETSAIVMPVGAAMVAVVLAKFLAFPFVVDPGAGNDATGLPVTAEERKVSKEATKDKDIRNASFSIGRMETVRSMERRGYLAQVAFSLISDRPLVGHGPGGWWRMQTQYPHGDHPAVQRQFRTYPAHRSPHSIWATVWVEYGAIGFGLFALWLISAAAVAVGGLRREEVRPDVVVEQASLGTAALAGVAVATVTPLFELAPSALVWTVAIAVLTTQSAKLNAYEGASVRWELGGDEPVGHGGRVLVGVLPALAAVACIGVATPDTVSKLYRGWGDQLMLRTYYKKATARYERADAWYPAYGDVLYNLAEAQSRLGMLEAPPVGSGAGQGVEPDETEDEEATPEETSSATKKKTRGSDAGGSSPDAGGGGQPTPPARGAASPKGTKRGDTSDGADATSGEGGGDGELLARASSMRPYDSRILVLVAKSWIRARYPRKGLRAARRAVEFHPNGVEPRTVLATALRSLGRYDEAAKQLLAVIDRDPPSRDKYSLHVQLGRLYFSSLEELQPAKEHFEKALSHVQSVHQRRQVQKKLKEVKKKIEHQRKLREGEPTEGMPQKPKMPGDQEGSGPGKGPMPPGLPQKKRPSK